MPTQFQQKLPGSLAWTQSSQSYHHLHVYTTTFCVQTAIKIVTEKWLYYNLHWVCSTL